MQKAKTAQLRVLPYNEQQKIESKALNFGLAFIGLYILAVFATLYAVFPASIDTAQFTAGAAFIVAGAALYVLVQHRYYAGHGIVKRMVQVLEVSTASINEAGATPTAQAAAAPAGQPQSVQEQPGQPGGR